MDTKDEIIKKAVSSLLKRHHLQEDSIGSIDDVVLSYVLSILEDLGDNTNTEENIDVDQFIEMMSAYIPGFSQIPSMEIYDWMFDISSHLSKRSTESSANIPRPDKEEVDKPQLNGTCNGKRSRHRSRKMSQSSCDSNSSTEKHDKRDGGEIKLLLEMFPASCTIEIKHCLKHCNGDLEETAQLILHRQESGTSLKPKQTEPQHRKCEARACGLEPDKTMKDHVVAKYSFVDTEDDDKTHRPPPPKQEPKKLIRYLDGKVVNTKGQKYTEIKKSEDEEMKKTYVSLKPAKQYRFH